jgi:hypothetical protein
MAMTQRCARPGCGVVATAWLSYDYAGRRVWLDDPGVEAGGHHSALCAAHAGRLRPPQGWSFQDRRTARASAAPPPPPPVNSGQEAPPAIAV